MFNQALIFAGGKGTRFLEETRFMPKPMIKANGIPLLVYIINHYKKYGVNEFFILMGYKQNIIKEYFDGSREYTLVNEDYICDDGSKVVLLDTGEETLTGGRLKIALEAHQLENFYLTYGDGISDVDISKLTEFHMQNGLIGTVTAVNPPPRFGLLEIEDDFVTKVREKNEIIPSWINGGFFVLNKRIFNYLTKDEPFEDTPLSKLSKDQQLSAYKHTGYWQCVDTIRELEILESDIENKKYKI